MATTQPRKKSVLIMQRVFPPQGGAAGRHANDLARFLAAHGYNVHILATRGAGMARVEKRADGVIIHRVRAPQNPTRGTTYIFILFLMFLRGLLIRRKDAIITLTDPPFLVVAGRFLSLIKRSRHIHWCHDLYPDLLPIVGLHVPKWILNFMEHRVIRAMKKCDRVITIGRCMSRHLNHLGVHQKQMTIIPNWADWEIYEQKEKLPQTDNDATPPDNSEERKFRVLYSGNMGLANPYETILEAAEILGATDPFIEFVFIGGGRKFEDLARDRSNRHLNNIKLLPYQPVENLYQSLRRGDLHLVSMHTDAGGLHIPCKFYSALAVERPVILIGPHQTEISKVIFDHKCGRVVAQHDPVALADAIRSFARVPNHWEAAIKGTAEAGQHYTPGGSLHRWKEKLDTILDH